MTIVCETLETVSGAEDAPTPTDSAEGLLGGSVEILLFRHKIVRNSRSMRTAYRPMLINGRVVTTLVGRVHRILL